MSFQKYSLGVRPDLWKLKTNMAYSTVIVFIRKYMRLTNSLNYLIQNEKDMVSR